MRSNNAIRTAKSAAPFFAVAKHKTAGSMYSVTANEALRRSLSIGCVTSTAVVLSS